MNHLPFTSFLAELEQRNIGYVLLRDHPEKQNIKDLDLLIDISKRKEFIDCGTQNRFQLIKAGRWNPGKLVMARWENGSAYILDIHERLIYRGFEYLDGKRVISRRRREGKYFFPSAEDELLTLLLHNVLGKGEIQKKHRARLKQLLKSKLDQRYLESHLQRFGLTQIFVNAQKEFDRLASEPDQVRKVRQLALRRLLFQPFANSFRRFKINYVHRIKKWFGPRRGALIVFIGPDGCGKSTITKELRALFRRATLAADIIYLGPWGQNKLPLQKLMSRLNIKPYLPEEKAAFRGDEPDLIKAKTRAPFFFRVKGVLFFLALTVELWARYLVLVLPKLRKGRVVLADRYVYDILIGYKNRPLKHFQSIRKWMCKHYPQPDLIVLLDAPPEVINARKPQFEVGQLTQIRQRYQQACRTFGYNKLDTSESVEATIFEFKSKLLPKVIQRLKP